MTGQFREILKNFNQNLFQYQQDWNPKDKKIDSGTTEASASAESTAKDAREAHHTA